MAENTSIEWCDHTFNPWTGCTKVSPGCAHCYAEALSKRAPKTIGGWGKGVPRKRTSIANWELPSKWNRAAEGAAQRPRVFCASLADWLDDEVPLEWLADLLVLIGETRNLDWLLLTKRPENWRNRISEAVAATNEGTQWATDWLYNAAPRNVWLGTTVEDQQRANERIPALLKIPAQVHFLSCEPLLGPVDLSAPRVWAYDCFPAKKWVIAGGESGHGARPMNPDWVRSLRDQCTTADVPFLFKQWGEYLEGEHYNDSSACSGRMAADGEFVRVGKKAAGRRLDGREWNEFPRTG